MKDHEIREFVNELTEAVSMCVGKDLLRERIAKVVHKHVPREPKVTSQDNEGWDALYGIKRG